MQYPLLEGPSKEGVFTIHLGASENRLDFNFIGKMHEHLDKIGN